MVGDKCETLNVREEGIKKDSLSSHPTLFLHPSSMQKILKNVLRIISINFSDFFIHLFL
jgi:hypothetical protein